MGSAVRYDFQVRVTGVLLNSKNQLLIVKQRVSESRQWSLPGGRLEHGETMEQAVVREVREETGLIAEVRQLLYLCDVSPMDKIIHATFFLDYIAGEITMPDNARDENPIADVKFVDANALADYGFSSIFVGLLKNDFPSRGSYMGDKANIGLGM